MSFRPRYFRRSTWLRARRSAVLWLCVVTLALQPLESLAAIRQQTQVAIGAPAAMSADPSVQLQKGARTAEYAEKDISFAAMSAVGFTPRPPQLAPLPSPPRQSLTLSGAQPPYPPNHVLDGSVEVVGTPPANHDFETTAIAVGTPPTNHDMATSYDALGVRTGAVVDGIASSFVWDRVTGQLVDDGAQGYVQAPGVLAQLGAAGRGDLLADGVGSVRGATDAAGALVGTADFGVFGQNRGQSGVASSIGFGGAFWTAALRDQSQAPAGLVSAALFGALPAAGSAGGSGSGASIALAHLERLQQINPTPNRFVGSAEDTDGGRGSGGGFGGFGGGGAPVGSPALALLLPQTTDPEPANRLPGPYTYASHRPTHGNGGVSALPGGNPGLFAAWLLGLEATENVGGLAGLGQAIVRVLLYVACVLDGECLASLTELQALGEEFGSAAQVTMRWTAKLLSRAADLWPLLPKIPRPLAELISFGVGFIPVVGDIYDLLSGLTGYDLITGDKLADWERALSISSAFMPLVSRHNLGITAKAPQWLDDVATLFRTGISGGTLRKIARALPLDVVIGVRGRPVVAALWQAIYLVTGKFEPKPGVLDAEEVAWIIRGKDFTSVLEFFGLRRMRDLDTGRTYFAHSDIDLQFIAENGAPVVNVERVKEIYGDVNNTFSKPIFRHGDNFSGLTQWVPNGPTLGRQNKTTIFISQSGYIGQGPGIAGFLGFLVPASRDAVETFLNMPGVP